MNNNSLIAVVIIVAIILLGVFFFDDIKNGIWLSETASTTPDIVVAPSTSGENANDPSSPLVVTLKTANPTETTSVLIGTVNPNGALTRYWYEYGTREVLGSKTTSQLLGSGYAVLPATAYVTQLTKDTTYYFRLAAENQYGKTTGAIYSFQTKSGVPPPVGTVPTVKSVSASGVQRTATTLNGEITPNKAATQYWFEYGRNVNLGNTLAPASAGDGSTKVSESASLSNLDPLTTYYFRINAQNQFGTVNGAILNFKTLGPEAARSLPTLVTRNATTVGSSTATLRGTVDPNGDSAQYWFEYSTDSLFAEASLRTTAKFSAGNSISPDSYARTVSGLVANTTYFYRIVAENSFGTSRGSSASFKTK